MPENKKAKSETAADGADVVLHAAETPAASKSKKPAAKKVTEKKPAVKKPAAKKPAMKKPASPKAEEPAASKAEEAPNLRRNNQ